MDFVCVYLCLSLRAFECCYVYAHAVACAYIHTIICISATNLRLSHLREGELQPLSPMFSSLSYNPAYVPGSKFGFVKLLATWEPHCTWWVDEQHRPAGLESRLVPDLSFPFIPALIGLRAFDLVSSPVWWEAATNIIHTIICEFSSVDHYKYTHISAVYWGSRGVMLIVAGYGHGDTTSNPGPDWLHFT